MRGWLVLALLAASATGQAAPSVAPLLPAEMEVAIVGPRAPIRPLGPFEALPVTLTYRYPEVLPEFDATPVVLSVLSAAPFGVVTLSPSTLYVPPGTPPCACQREAQLQAYLLVSTTADAPAFRDFVVEVAAEAPAHGLVAPAHGTSQVKPQAGYFAIVEATTPEHNLRFPPGEERRIPITVTNFGNGASTVTFEVLEPPPKDVVVVPPPTTRLGARQQGEGNVAFLEMVLRAGAAPDGELWLQVRATSTEVPGADEDTTFLVFTVRPRGGTAPAGVQSAGAAREVPGPELAALLVGVACLARIRRRP